MINNDFAETRDLLANLKIHVGNLFQFINVFIKYLKNRRCLCSIWNKTGDNQQDCCDVKVTINLVTVIEIVQSLVFNLGYLNTSTLLQLQMVFITEVLHNYRHVNIKSSYS